MPRGSASPPLSRIMLAVLAGSSVYLCATALPCETVEGAVVPPILTQAHAAFSSGAEIKTVSITGSVTWIAGSTEDAGTFSFSASEDGSSTMKLLMNTRGAYQEVYGAVGAGRTCEWQVADGVTHSSEDTLCAVPISLFLPSLSLQPTASNIVIVDHGINSSGSLSLRTLRLSSVEDSPPSRQGMPADYGVVTLGLDATTLLPVSASQRIFPGMNPLSPVVVEVEYPQYVKVDGVQIPRSIVRHLNGAVDLTLTVTGVTVGQSSVTL